MGELWIEAGILIHTPLQPDYKATLLYTVQRSTVGLEDQERNFSAIKYQYQLLFFSLGS